MYLIELIVKWINPNKKYEFRKKFDPFAKDDIEEESDNCEHIFLPIDSSKEILACSKCGLVVNKSDLKDKNIFRNKKRVI